MWVQLATVRNGRPAVRTVVHRGIVNDSWVGQPCLTFVTDARSEKVKQINSNHFAEVAWYFAITREQWRISGSLAIVTATAHVGFSDPSWTPEALQNARRAAWLRMSDAGRAQFAWPSPGTSRTEQNSAFISALPLEPAPPAGAVVEQPSDSGASPSTDASEAATHAARSMSEAAGEMAPAPANAQAGQATDIDAPEQRVDLDVLERAYANFALCLMRPDEADWLCLKYAPTQRRAKYKLLTEDGDSNGCRWVVEEVNP